MSAPEGAGTTTSPEPGENVRAVIDRTGDVWVRTDDGWMCGVEQMPWSEMTFDFGPVQPLVPAPPFEGTVPPVSATGRHSHHNALLCPYCKPLALRLIDAGFGWANSILMCWHGVEGWTWQRCLDAGDEWDAAVAAVQGVRR